MLGHRRSEYGRLGGLAVPEDATVHDETLHPQSALWPVIHHVDMCLQVGFKQFEAKDGPSHVMIPVTSRFSTYYLIPWHWRASVNHCRVCFQDV